MPLGCLIDYFAWQSFSKTISSGDNKSRERGDILTNIFSGKSINCQRMTETLRQTMAHWRGLQFKVEDDIKARFSGTRENKKSGRGKTRRGGRG